MYTREEASRIRQEFWLTFGQYMRPVPSSSGEKVNWINYNTRFKSIRFRLDASNQGVLARIEIYGDEEYRNRLFKIMRTMEEELQASIPASWYDETLTDGRKISLVEWKNDHLNIFRRDDWPEIISFLKEKIMVMDRFWTANKEVLETV